MEAPASRMNVYWWTNMGVFALLAALLALSVRLVVPLPWYGWPPALLASLAVSHLLVERLLSRYTNHVVGAILSRRDATRIVEDLTKRIRSQTVKETEELRDMITERVEACNDPQFVYVNLVGRVHRRRWPPWAEQAMPWLYVQLGRTRTGRKIGLMWEHIRLCIPKSHDVKLLAAHGQFTEVTMSSDTAKFVEFVVPVFERLRRQISSPTVAVVGQALQEIELRFKDKSPEAAASIADSRKLLLQAAGILPVDKIAKESAAPPPQVLPILRAIGELICSTMPKGKPGGKHEEGTTDSDLELLVSLVIWIVAPRNNPLQP